MKSGYYLATVINAYRKAMDGGDMSISEKELLRVAHRDYTEAYADGQNANTVNYTDSQSKGEYTYIADVLSSDGGYAVVEMRNRFKLGDTLEVLAPDGNFAKSFPVTEIVDSKGQKTDDAKLVCEHYQIACPYDLKKGDYLRRRVEV
jgi:putative protease